MPTDKQGWIEYEANVRCPVRGTRGRVGIGQGRRQLAREWARFSQGEKIACGKNVRVGQEADQARLDHEANATVRLGDAIAIFTGPGSNSRTKQYFDICREAHLLQVEWRSQSRLAKAAWTNLRRIYRQVPVANRSPDQVASLAEAQQRINAATAARNNAINSITALLARMQTGPIYQNPLHNVKALEEHVPDERKPIKDLSITRSFVSDNVPGTLWRTVQQGLYAGRNNTIRVWCTVDGNGNIVDRLVRKEQDVRDLYEFTQFKGILPWELECQRLASLEDAGNALKSVVPLRDTNLQTVRSWVDRARSMYKVYMAWCPHGALQDLIEGELPADQRELFPEPFIWHIAQGLIGGGQIMATTNNGEQMVHRDLKPANIFLGASDFGDHPNYPQPFIADFGGAFMTSSNDERNPDWWNYGGTAGFRPAELQRYVDPITILPVNATQLLEHTNVWQAGAVLRALVLLERYPSQSLFLDGVNDDTYRVDVVGSEAVANYSADLLQMIDDMMAYTSSARPSFDDLRIRIDNLNDVSQGMRDATATDAQRLAFGVAVKADEYAIGMAPP